MRPHFLSFALLLAACTETNPRSPPTDRFVFPSGLVHRVPSGSTNGVLYVASANFDRCYDQGTLMAVDLDQVRGSGGESLPALGAPGAPVSTTPLKLEQLNVPEAARVLIQSYAGEMAVWDRTDGTSRIFIPARADGDFLHSIDALEPTRLTCVGAPESRNCIDGALSLTNVPWRQGDAEARGDLPRAPAPFGVDVTPEGQVWVTHVDPADSPARSLNNFLSYVVRLDAETPSLSRESFVPLETSGQAIGGSHSVDATGRYTVVSGRFSNQVLNNTGRRFLLRLLDTQNGNRIIDPGLDLAYAARDARGFALTPASATRPRRLYLAVRSPDSLVVMDAQGLDTDTPSLRLVDSLPMPDGPTQVALVPRGEGRSELVVVSCSAAGVVAIYDPDVGQVVSQIAVSEVPREQVSQPFGIAVQQQGNAARLFVSNFGDGRVSVIDLPDLSSPQLARLVAHLGARQDAQGSSTCQEVQQ
jgi:DNA-binding beta-propeller fold protein YncE